ncbi:GH32 C-terminal domain-containing protein [Brachybacterium sp. DNPG3]
MTAPSAALTDRHRPALHLTPGSTWMNDPNGLIRHDGRWHAFFQTNPEGSQWGRISWGHAVSDDLATWEELPIAIPSSETELIFSGSVVHDAANVSGLGTGAAGSGDGAGSGAGGSGDGSAADGPLLAFYTSAYTDRHPTLAGRQAQSVASSTDGGLTWTPYPGNPVLDRGSENFRDPKVLWHEETGRWVMVTVEALDHTVHLFTSRDLLTWEHASAFTHPALDGGIWECPDLLRVPVDGPTTESDDGSAREAWVLIVSTNPGGPAGGSGAWCFVGEFDGTAFTTADEQPRPLDLGPDCYAIVSFAGVAGEPLLLGWMNNWAYASTTPTDPWRSSMTLPRRLGLRSGGAGLLELVQRPVVPEGIETLDLGRIEDPQADGRRSAGPRSAGRHSDGPRSEGSRLLAEVDGTRAFRCRGTLPVGRAQRLVLRWTTDVGLRELAIEIAADGSVVMDRSLAHRDEFAPEHPRSAASPTVPGAAEVVLDLVVDRSCAELSIDDGRELISQQIFPGPGAVEILVEFA